MRNAQEPSLSFWDLGSSGEHRQRTNGYIKQLQVVVSTLQKTTRHKDFQETHRSQSSWTKHPSGSIFPRSIKSTSLQRPHFQAGFTLWSSKESSIKINTFEFQLSHWEDNNFSKLQFPQLWHRDNNLYFVGPLREPETVYVSWQELPTSPLNVLSSF